MIRAVGIACKPIRKVICDVVPPLIDWLRERNIESLLDSETQACLDPRLTGISRDKLGAKVDLLIVLGGDGTLLSAARALHGHPVPILAVNFGALGFLTSVTLDELYPVLEQTLAGKQSASERMMLESAVMRNGIETERHRALNDAVVTKSALARMLAFDVHVDKHHVGHYRADGIIVATPTGSTAYSLAAGGPIIHPDLDTFVITPICPHMLTNRPLVISGSAKVEVDFSASEEPVYLTLDGQLGLQLSATDRVAITKSATKVKLVRPPNKTYYEILRNKLRWGER